MTYAGAPYPAMVEKFAAAKEWESALRLCRYVKSPVSSGQHASPPPGYHGTVQLGSQRCVCVGM